MDIAGIHVPALVAMGGAFSSVYSAFSRFDRIQSPANRKFVSIWVKGIKIDPSGWDHFYNETFTKFFGERHLSFKRFSRTVLLTVHW
jgi:hypothetical protein